MLHLTLKQAPVIPLELDGITPDRVRQCTVTDVSKLPIFHGNRRVELGEFFDVTGDPKCGEISFHGDCSRIKLLGAKMTSGRMIIDGNAGWHTGAGMLGGELVIRGNAGDWVGAEMRGGVIRVEGNAGNQLGAAYRGSRHGMRGGVIHVRGNVGDEAGLLMRRGMIVVDGRVGDFAGASMIAGTLVAFSGAGRALGAGMKRGTLLIDGNLAELSPGFRYSCDYRPAYLGVLLQELRHLNCHPAENLLTTTLRCYRGDAVHGSNGELWVFKR